MGGINFVWLSGLWAQTGSVANWRYATFFRRLGEAAAPGGMWVRAVPRLCIVYPGICLATEEKSRKSSVRLTEKRWADQRRTLLCLAGFFSIFTWRLRRQFHNSNLKVLATSQPKPPVFLLSPNLSDIGRGYYWDGVRSGAPRADGKMCSIYHHPYSDFEGKGTTHNSTFPWLRAVFNLCTVKAVNI